MLKIYFYLGIKYLLKVFEIQCEIVTLNKSIFKVFGKHEKYSEYSVLNTYLLYLEHYPSLYFDNVFSEHKTVT